MAGSSEGIGKEEEIKAAVKERKGEKEGREKKGRQQV